MVNQGQIHFANILAHIQNDFLSFGNLDAFQHDAVVHDPKSPRTVHVHQLYLGHRQTVNGFGNNHQIARSHIVGDLGMIPVVLINDLILDRL